MQPPEQMLPKGYEKLSNGDLVFNDNNLRVNAYETQGKRESQEDCMAINEVPGFAQLTSPQQRRILLRTYDAINEKLKSLMVNNTNLTGTTALTCFSYMTKNDNKTIVNIISANLADSSAYFFIRNKATGKIRRCARINNNLHKPNDPTETTRIKQAGGFVKDKRVDELCAVARAFGDFVLSGKVIHTPDINDVSIELNPGEELLLIGACDGLTENKLVKGGKEPKFVSNTGVIDAVPGSEILALNIFIEQECAQLDFSKLPKALANWAINTNYSRDNVSVIVQSIDADSQAPILPHAIMLAIFDGHGGIAVSNFVANIFCKTLLEQIQLLQNPNLQKNNATLRIPPPAEIDSDVGVIDEQDEKDAFPLIPPREPLKITTVQPEELNNLPAKLAEDAPPPASPPIPISRPVKSYALNKPAKLIDASANSEVIDMKPLTPTIPLREPIKAAIQNKELSVPSSELISERVWLTEAVTVKIESDYQKKLDAKIIKISSSESEQLRAALKANDTLAIKQKKINDYLANEKYKNKRLYEILIENRIHAQIELAVRNKEPMMYSAQVENSWLNNSTIDDICFLIDKRYTQARGFKFFGITSKDSFLLLERLRKPTNSVQDKEEKRRVIEDYSKKDADTRLFNIITALFVELDKIYREALYNNLRNVP